MAMNPWNRFFMVQAWFVALCGAGGFVFAHTAGPALAALAIETLLVTAVIAGSDRHDRECPTMQESDR